MDRDRVRSVFRVTFTLLLAGTASLAAPALGQVSGDAGSDPVERLAAPHLPHPRAGSPAHVGPARATGVNDSTWVGHSIQTQNPLDHTTFSYGPFHAGVGLFRPRAGGSAAENIGFWG